MSRLWMQFALFINAVTPVHFLIAATVYALFLYEADLRHGVLIFVGTMIVVFIAVGVLKLTTRVPRRSDALVAMNNANRAFPSGHAASSAFVAMMVPYTLSTVLSIGAIAVLAALLAFASVTVAASRLTLRVHTVTQVAVGLAIGMVLPLVSIYYLSPLVQGLF